MKQTPYHIVAKAGLAVAELTTRVRTTFAKVDPADRAGALRRIGMAAILARELVMRIELAELELAAQATSYPRKGEAA